jgi:DNA-binding transcriptional LysR family regulator
MIAVLDVHRLRLLRELHRCGTLAAVARALSYSPSAISQQLSLLEAETGVQLLEHVGRGVRLTGQARILVAHTEAILEQLEAAEAELAASLTEVGGTLRVASFQSVLLALVPAALSRLAVQHPQLRVEISDREADAAFGGLLAREFDVVLGEEYQGLPQPPTAGAQTEDLAYDEIRLAFPLHGPYAAVVPERAGPADLADLADVPWVLDPADTEPGQWARTLCRTAGFEPDVRFESSDLLLQVHLVETGHAVALLPDLLFTDRRAEIRLCHLPDRPRRRLYTAVRAGAADHPTLRAFRSALQYGLGHGPQPAES